MKDTSLSSSSTALPTAAAAGNASSHPSKDLSTHRPTTPPPANMRTLPVAEEMRRVLLLLGDKLDSRFEILSVAPQPISSAAASSEEQPYKGELVLLDLQPNGSLHTTLGELTPPKAGIFRHPAIKPIADWGEFLLADTPIRRILQPHGNLPSKIKLHAIHPKKLAALGRPDLRRVMEQLAPPHCTMQIPICVVINNKHYTEHHKFHESSSTISAATMLAIAVALRKTAFNNTDGLFAELIGSAPAVVIEELLPFARPPLLGIAEIPRLVHSAARHCIHRHHGHNPTPSTVACRIGDVVATLLEHGEMNDVDQRTFQYFFWKTFAHQAGNDDRGFQVGLVLAGIKKYIGAGKGKVAKRVRTGKLIVESIFGGLSGIPVGGFLFSMGAPSVSAGVQRFLGRKEEELDRLSRLIKQYYDENIGTRIAIDKCLEIKSGGGGTETVLIDDVVYQEWFRHAMEWNEVHL